MSIAPQGSEGQIEVRVQTKDIVVNPPSSGRTPDRVTTFPLSPPMEPVWWRYNVLRAKLGTVHGN